MKLYVGHDTYHDRDYLLTVHEDVTATRSPPGRAWPSGGRPGARRPSCCRSRREVSS